MPKLELEMKFACGEDWNAMSGDARQRHCDSCQRNIVNLSEYTEREAYRIARRELKNGYFCALFELDDDQIVFRPEPIRAVHLKKSLVVAALISPLFAGCERLEAPAERAVAISVAPQDGTVGEADGRPEDRPGAASPTPPPARTAIDRAESRRFQVDGLSTRPVNSPEQSSEPANEPANEPAPRRLMGIMIEKGF